MMLPAVIVGASLCLGLASVGAYLVVNGHPWFGLLAFLLAASVRVQITKGGA